MASCIKSTEINMPKSSPATLVNLVMSVQALSIARTHNITAVQTQTLIQEEYILLYHKHERNNKPLIYSVYHPAQARNSFLPNSGLSLAKVYK